MWMRAPATLWGRRFRLGSGGRSDLSQQDCKKATVLNSEEMTKNEVQKLTQQVNQLKTSEERFELALEATSDGVWDWNINNNETYINSAYCTMLGYQPGDLGNDAKSQWMDLLHPEEIESVLATAKEKLKQDGIYEIEFRMRCKDGSYKWILSRGKVFRRDSDGKPTRAVGTHIDLTARKQFEIELREAKRQSDAASRAKSYFLANMSSELQSPLTNIIGLVDTLQRRNDLNSDVEDKLGKIAKYSKYLQSILDGVFEKSTIQVGKLAMEITALPSSAMMEMLRKQEQDFAFNPQGYSQLDVVCDYIRANLETKFTLSELEGISGLTSRALQYAFQKRFNCSPKHWIAEQKLIVVRSYLLAAAPEDKVSRIASKFFSNMGDFARLYQLKFGEMPSETLRSTRKIESD
jgi:PAS domain S-box-containing protein